MCRPLRSYILFVSVMRIYHAGIGNLCVVAFASWRQIFIASSARNMAEARREGSWCASFSWRPSSRRLFQWRRKQRRRQVNVTAWRCRGGEEAIKRNVSRGDTVKRPGAAKTALLAAAAAGGSVAAAAGGGSGGNGGAWRRGSSWHGWRHGWQAAYHVTWLSITQTTITSTANAIELLASSLAISPISPEAGSRLPSLSLLCEAVTWRRRGRRQKAESSVYSGRQHLKCLWLGGLSRDCLSFCSLRPLILLSYAYQCVRRLGV